MGFGAVIRLNKRGYALIGLLVVISLYFHFHGRGLIGTEEQISLPCLLQTAIQAAETGGKIVVSVKNDLKIESKGKTKEGLVDSVTTADFASHCVMKHIITSTFPAINFISEEKNIPCDDTHIGVHEHSVKPIIYLPESLVKASDVTIWIDPLDATYEYTEKLYQYVTTMVCIAIKGEPVIGVIHKPFNKTTSWAVVGYGHSIDLKGLTTKDTSRKTRIIISRSHSGTIEDVLKKSFENFEVITAAGAGYKALKVADGTVDAYLHITAIKKWDICAGNAILNALGGRMTTKYGKALTYYNDTDVVNQDGLIATLKNHDLFVNKL